MMGNALANIKKIIDSLKTNQGNHFPETSKKEDASILPDQDQGEQLTIHRKRKAELPPRVHVLRVLIRKKYDDKRLTMSEDEFCNRVESLLDRVLVKFNYDLEAAIDHYRGLELEKYDKFGVCKTCGYVPPFCPCEKPSNPTYGVTCNDCKNFAPDRIGDGVGIGTCRLGLIATLAMNGNKPMPLYRFARRRCDSFEIKNKAVNDK